MGHQLGEGEDRKKQPDCGFEPWELWARAVAETDIDPADFFDPEDLGFRRRGYASEEPILLRPRIPLKMAGCGARMRFGAWLRASRKAG